MSRGKWKPKEPQEEPQIEPVDKFAALIEARRGPRDKYRDIRREKRRAVLEAMSKGNAQ